MGRLLFRRGRVIFGKSSEEMDVLVEERKSLRWEKIWRQTEPQW